MEKSIPMSTSLDIISSTNQRDLRCSVCNEMANGCRYGVPACLGCIVFFRRSVLSNKQYQCNKNGNCPINKSRCICRSCRLQTCFDVGMNPAAIQRRDLVGPRKNIGKIERKRNVMDTETVPAIQSKTSVILLLPSTSSTETYSWLSTSGTNTLDLIDAMQKRQMICQLSLFRVDEINIAMDNLVALDRNMLFTGLRRARYYDLNSIGRVALLNAAEWGQTFPVFSNLSAEMKASVLRLFAMSFALIENGYLTSRQEDPDLWILPNNTYLCTDYYRGMTEQVLNRPDNHTRAKILLEAVVNVIREVAEPMRQLKIDLKECAALKTIVLWNCGTDLSFETQQLFMRERDTMLAQLMQYCWTKKCNDDSAVERFGSLVLLVSNIMRLTRVYGLPIYINETVFESNDWQTCSRTLEHTSKNFVS